MPALRSTRPLLLLALVLVLTAITVHALGWDDVARLRSAALGAGWGGALLFAAGYAALTLTPLPKNALSSTAGFLFGFSTGLAVVWLGAVSGALLAFGFARRLGRGRSLLTAARLRRLDEQLHRHSLLGAVLVRLVPVLPFTVVNYGSGFTSLRFRDYALGTAVGILPGSAVFVGLGAGTTRLPAWALLSAGVTAAVALTVLMRRRPARARRD